MDGIVESPMDDKQTPRLPEDDVEPNGGETDVGGDGGGMAMAVDEPNGGEVHSYGEIMGITTGARSLRSASDPTAVAGLLECPKHDYREESNCKRTSVQATQWGR